MAGHAGTIQNQTSAQSGRKAGCQYHCIQEPVQETYIVPVQKVAHGIEIRYTRHEIEHTCPQCYFRSRADIEHISSGRYDRGYEGCTDEHYPDIYPVFQHYLPESVSGKCREENYPHRNEVAAEKPAERGVRQRSKQEHDPSALRRSVQYLLHPPACLPEIHLPVMEFPAQAAHRSIDAETRSRLAYLLDIAV